MGENKKYKGIDKEKIKDVAEVRFERSKFPQIDMQIVEAELSRSQTFLDKIREFAHSEALRYAYDLDMCCICEMAMLYLDEKENATNYGKSMYDKGLNDAWELVRKIMYSNSQKIFGHMFSRQVFDNFTPQEAFEKFEAYEKEQAQINVGDVVTDGQTSMLVTGIGGKSGLLFLLGKNGEIMTRQNPEHYTKTGQTLDIQSILSQIGGEVDGQIG